MRNITISLALLFMFITPAFADDAARQAQRATEARIADEYLFCAKRTPRGGTVERECAADGEAKCKEAGFHETCFYDAAFDQISRGRR